MKPALSEIRHRATERVPALRSCEDEIRRARFVHLQEKAREIQRVLAASTYVARFCAGEWRRERLKEPERQREAGRCSREVLAARREALSTGGGELPPVPATLVKAFPELGNPSTLLLLTKQLLSDYERVQRGDIASVIDRTVSTSAEIRDLAERVIPIFEPAQQLFDSLILENSGLVYAVLGRLCPKAREQYEGDGQLGLIRAVDKFDLDRGFQFSTYATTVIQRFVRAALKRESHGLIAKPRELTPIQTVEREHYRLQKTLRRPPTEEEFVAHLVGNQIKVPKSEVLLRILGGGASASMRPVLQVSEDGGFLRSRVESDATDSLSRAAFSEEWGLLGKFLWELPEDYREVVCARFGLYSYGRLSLEEVGKHRARSRERVRQIEEVGVALVTLAREAVLELDIPFHEVKRYLASAALAELSKLVRAQRVKSAGAPRKIDGIEEIRRSKP